jgi:hypothetical protein
VDTVHPATGGSGGLEAGKRFSRMNISARERKMPNRTLNADELVHADELLSDIRQQLASLADGDRLLLFAYRRKVAKELVYDERDKPAARVKLKAQKRRQQNNNCAHCDHELPLKYCELDRKNAVDGYTPENTELLHGECHRARQAAKRFS